MTEHVVLLVEDDDTLRLIASRELQRLQPERRFRLVEASDGEQALRALADELDRANQVLVLCDYLMPGTSGLDVLRAIRVHPKAGQVRFLFLSSLERREEERIARELGAHRFIVKPFDLDELRSVLRSEIDAWRGTLKPA